MKVYLSAALLAAGSIAAFGAAVPLPVCGTTATGGTATTLQDYINDYGSTGCTIADKTFSSFGYVGGAQGGAAIITAVGITVVPDALNPLNPGIDFFASWAVQSQNGVAETEDSAISFQVTVTDGSARIKDDTLSVPTYTVSGTGNATHITENVCLGGTFVSLACVGGTDQSPILNIPCAPTSGSTCTGNNLTMNVGPFGPYVTVGVFKDINLNSGTNGGASFSEVGQNFSQVPVPEPVGVLLLGTCLLAISPILKRRLSKS